MFKIIYFKSKIVRIKMAISEEDEAFRPL